MIHRQLWIYQALVWASAALGSVVIASKML